MLLRSVRAFFVSAILKIDVMAEVVGVLQIGRQSASS
jgi:hypothetical protein